MSIEHSQFNFRWITYKGRLACIEHRGKHEKPRAYIGSRLLKNSLSARFSRADCLRGRCSRHFLAGFFGQRRGKVAFTEAASDRNDGLAGHFRPLG